MPTIDVTRVLSNPKFYTFFNVYRYDEYVDENGLTQTTNPKKFMGITGVVTGIGSAQLIRVPEEERLKGLIAIYTTFRLQGGSREIKSNQLPFSPRQSNTATIPDEVEWPQNSGDFYTVVQVDDWSEYGAGFIQASCMARQISPP